MRNLYIDYVIKPRIWMPAYNFTTGRNRKLFRETWSWTRAATYRALHRFPSQRRYIIQIDPNWSAITKEQALYIPAFTFFLLRRETEPIVALDSKLDPKIRLRIESSPPSLSPRDNVFPRARKRNFFLPPYRNRKRSNDFMACRNSTWLPWNSRLTAAISISTYDPAVLSSKWSWSRKVIVDSCLAIMILILCTRYLKCTRAI